MRTVSAMKAQRLRASARAPKVIESKGIRVCSFPNDQWQAQRYEGPGGDAQIDPWKALGRPTVLSEAVRQANSYALRQGVERSQLIQV